TLIAGANKIENRTEHNAALDKAIEMLMKAQNICMDVIDAFSGKDAETVARKFTEINGTLKHARSLKVLDKDSTPPPTTTKEPPRDRPKDEKPKPREHRSDRDSEPDIESLEAAREFYGLGLASLKAKQYDKARELFTKSISYNKDFPDAYAKLGDICAVLKDEEAGYGYYQQCIEIINRNQSPSEEMIKLRDDTMRKIEKFIALEEKIAALNRELISKLLELAKQCVAEEDYILSEEILSLALQLDRNNDEAAGLLGKTREEINKTPKDKSVTENGEHRSDRDSELANLYYQSGLELLKANKYNEAVEKFNKAMSYREGFAEALFNIGECYRKLNDNKKALNNYRLCARCLKQRFMSKEDEKLLSQAQQVLDKIDPNGKKFTAIRNNYSASSLTLANDCANRKYNSFAWRIVQYLLLVEPNNKNAQELSAKLDASRMGAGAGKPEPKAEAGASDEKRKRAESYLRTAQPLFYNAEYNNLIATCSEAIKIDPSCALAYAWRGLAYWKKNDLAQMNSDLEKAFELDPDNPQLAEMKKTFEPLRKFGATDKKPETGQIQTLFNGKDIDNWEIRDKSAGVWGRERYQNWRVKDGRLEADPRVIDSEAILIWKDKVPDKYTLTVRFSIERNRSSRTNPLGFIYGQSGAGYEAVSISSSQCAAGSHKFELIREDGRYKALLDGKTAKDGFSSSGTPSIGLLVKNGHVIFSSITLQEMK
ncbi:MAG: tetratricopeptide repeat protein, partial [Planctomycetota bacterium]